MTDQTAVDTSGEPHAGQSPWGPLRHRTFRGLWLAQTGSNVGTWMQTVGAQWLLVGHGASLVSLVQTASLIPVLMLSLPAGVLADTLDRRRLLFVSMTGLAVCADWRNAALALTDGTAPVVEHLFPPQLDMTRLAHPPPGGPSAST